MLCCVLVLFGVLTNLHLAKVVLVISSLALIVFPFMPLFLRRKFMKTTAKAVEFSLSQRYQMSENYRSAKLLARVVICFGLCNLLGALFYVLSRYGPDRFILYFCYILCFKSQTIFYPILVIIYEPKIRDLICLNKNNVSFLRFFSVKVVEF